jgi:2-polyprenyl-6-methoxyphenol hydroxylase-like FAD-dependent oxidoreductase
MTTTDVFIRGAGVVGPTLALLLAKERLRVTLVQSPTPPQHTPDIRAYALNAASHQLLDTVKGWPTNAHAVTPVHHMWVCEPNTDTPAAVRFDAQATPLSWIVDVPALEQQLAQAVQYQPGITVIAADAPAPKAALTVVCEGKRSHTREQLGFQYGVKPYPHTAVAARLQCSRPHGGVARQWFAQGDVVALLPLGGEGGHEVALVWSQPHDRAQALLAQPAEAFAQAVQTVCDHALGTMQLNGTPAGWPLELSRATQWVQPGVALAGDAAHAMHPLAGQGLNVGLADVAELARVLAAREYWRELGDIKLLRRYERARQAHCGQLALATDGLFGLFNHSDSRIQALRRWGLQGFDRLPSLKQWVMQQAQGVA